MTYKFSEFPGIEHDHVTKLRGVGIETTDDMMRIWADELGRRSLVEKTGLSLEQFAKLASMARLARVNNVGTKYVAAMLAAGIDGPKSLFEYTPESLVKRLGEVKAEKKLTVDVPQLSDVADWFTHEKPMVARA
ncbi:MAG TPA: DUF4332 domain-containing protein [Candidatus Eisenbacteria bacterium]|nr:DUF4332 domain-containing protein [Candidatus Eisenbacteria bacterium]